MEAMMNERDAAFWAARMLRALGKVGIFGVRAEVAAIPPAEVKAAALACEVAASRIERGMDARPASVAGALALGRSVRYVDGASVCLPGCGGGVRADGDREITELRREPLNRAKWKAKSGDEVEAEVEGDGGEAKVGTYVWRKTQRRRLELARALHEVGSGGIGMSDLLRRLAMTDTSHTRLKIDLKAVAEELGRELIVERDHAVRGRRVTVRLGAVITRSEVAA